MKHTHRVFAAALVLFVLAIGCVSAQQDDMMAAADRNVSYPGPGGVTLEGYLATPSGSGPHPAVIMIHEWWGLNNDIARLADALAQEGYVVLAPDVFRGSVAQNASGAMQQVRNTPREQIQRDLDAAVTFYGSGPITDASQLGVMGQNAPVLGVFGEEDGNIPVTEVKGFRSALQQRNIEHTVTIYPGVGHAFVDSENYNRSGPPGRAWRQLLSFLDQNL